MTKEIQNILDRLLFLLVLITVAVIVPSENLILNKKLTLNGDGIDDNHNIKMVYDMEVNRNKDIDELMDNYEVLDKDVLTTNNPCLVHYCTKGRECVIDLNGEPDCICQQVCTHRKKMVCATNGKIYDNHCELHRDACRLGRPLSLQRMDKCLTTVITSMESTNKKSKKITTESMAYHNDHNHKSIVIYRESVTTIDPLPPLSKTKTTTLLNQEPQISSQANPTKSNNNRHMNYINVVHRNEVDTVSILPNKSDISFESADEEISDQSTLQFNLRNHQCTVQEYEIMKDNLLLYNHARLMSQDNNHSKDFLVSIMFSHYDENNNGHLDNDELHTVSVVEHLEELSNGCTLNDMIAYDDSDHDGQLSVNEFNQAFSKLYSVSVVSLDKSLEVNHLSARVDDNVEIKCDVTGSPSPPILWKRNNIDLSILNNDDVRVFNDGSLYLTRIQLIHAGNYTCHAQRNKDIVQTHVLTVHTIPEVHVMPRIQSRKPGESATIYCHVIGEPFPLVDWLKNEDLLKMDLMAQGQPKYELLANGSSLKIHNIVYADTGAYMCQATNIGGRTIDISSLIVQESPTPTLLVEEAKFMVFHDHGIAIYEAEACRLHHQIQGTETIPGTEEFVCGENNEVICSWGQAINVGSNYIYISQPNFDRILIISILQMQIIDIVLTDRYPVNLYYVPHFDQVWVLNWRDSSSDTTDKMDLKTIQVIRDATKKHKHHTVHPEPVDGQFDLVKNLFIPLPNLELTDNNFKYGFVTHKNQRGIYKLDLANLRYTRSIDLTLYNCVPDSMEFSAVYGFVIMSCREPITNRPQGQLILDYLTESVLTMKTGLNGFPKISPDSRSVAIIDHTHDGVLIVVQRITSNGLEFEFDVKTSLNISDITFFDSQTTHGYDLYASASDKEDILFLNLYTEKVEMITGVGTAISELLVKWNNPVRPIKSSDIFGQYIVTPSNNAIFVVNGKQRTINCEIGGILHPIVIVWTKSPINNELKSINSN